MDVFPQRFYARFRQTTSRGTRTTTARTPSAGGSRKLDHVLVALRKDLRETLAWDEHELSGQGWHTAIPGLGERGVYVIALSPQDAELAARFGKALLEREVLR
ncbi:MAG TPA: hypothetical protein VM681_09320 [Candidatus Thermoplasmatota archaeon]|nr:hypothetical protein [Candidatus Thermoplasmatota archaeon]